MTEPTLTLQTNDERFVEVRKDVACRVSGYISTMQEDLDGDEIIPLVHSSCTFETVDFLVSWMNRIHDMPDDKEILRISMASELSSKTNGRDLGLVQKIKTAADFLLIKYLDEPRWWDELQPWKLYRVAILEREYVTVEIPISEFGTATAGYITLFQAISIGVVHSPSSSGHARYSFHKFVSAAPFTREFWKIPAKDQRPDWTVLELDCDRPVEPSFLRDETGGADPLKTFLCIGLKIPKQSDTTLVCGSSRMHRAKYPRLGETVWALGQEKEDDQITTYSIPEYRGVVGKLLLPKGFAWRKGYRGMIDRWNLLQVDSIDKSGLVWLCSVQYDSTMWASMLLREKENECALLLMKELARATQRRVADLYDCFGWDLSDEAGFSSLLDAFRHLLTDESLLRPFGLDPFVHDSLLHVLRLRLASVAELPRGLSSCIEELMDMGIEASWDLMAAALTKHDLQVADAARELSRAGVPRAYEGA
jgi:hypothetical protein